MEGRDTLKGQSYGYHKLWEQGKEQGLITIVQHDGVREPWVQEAIDGRGRSRGGLIEY